MRPRPASVAARPGPRGRGTAAGLTCLKQKHPRLFARLQTSSNGVPRERMDASASAPATVVPDDRTEIRPSAFMLPTSGLSGEYPVIGSAEDEALDVSTETTMEIRRLQQTAARRRARLELARDTIVEPPPHIRGAMCIVVSGQLSLGLFEQAALEHRGRQQRDATRGEQEGTLMPPGPLAHTATKNLALFTEGEVFNLRAIPNEDAYTRTAAFSICHAVVVVLAGEVIRQLAERVLDLELTIANGLALTNARLRSITGIKHEILDFYVRNGLSVAGPSVRLRQLDLCIDCKQCEDACERRHGARRLTLGGFELGILDVVFSCRTCTDARCLSPCEHDAIKRDPETGEVKIHEDRCIGCSLCALSCPYGAIDMVNVAEPEMPTFKPRFKERLEKAHKLGFGPGKGRKAPARRIANKCDHCAGYAAQACVSACPTGSLIEISPATLFRERTAPTGRRKRKRLHVLPVQPFVDGINVRDSGEARVRVRKLSFVLWLLGLASFLAILAEVGLRWFAPTWPASYRMLLLDGLDPGIAELNVSYLAGSGLALTCGYLASSRRCHRPRRRPARRDRPGTRRRRPPRSA